MKGDEKDTGKEPNTSAKDGGRSASKGGGAVAGGAPESEALTDDLESRLDELFASDYDTEPDAAAAPPVAKPSSAKAAGPPKTRKGTAAPVRAKKPADIYVPRVAKPIPRPDSAKPRVMRKNAVPPLILQPPESEAGAASAAAGAKKPAAIRPVDSVFAAAPAPQQSEAPPPVRPQPQPDGIAAGAAGTAKSPDPAKPQPPSGKSAPRRDQPAAAAAVEKEPTQAGRKPGKRKYGIRAAVLGGIVLIGAVIALRLFFRAPQPSAPARTGPVVVAHRIEPPPLKPGPAPIKRISDPIAAQGADGGRIQPQPPAGDTAGEQASAAGAGPQSERVAAEVAAAGSARPQPAGADSGAAEEAGSAVESQNDASAAKEDAAPPLQPQAPPATAVVTQAPAAARGPQNETAAAGKTAAASLDTKKTVSVPGPENSAAAVHRDVPGAVFSKTASYPYSIHASSYRSLASARDEVEAFGKMGLEAYWVPVDLAEKGFWYRVLIGHYRDAESAASVIKSKKLRDAIVRETRYANLIGTYTSDERLLTQRLLLLKKGFCPYVVAEPRGGRRLYVGAYDTLKNVEKLADELNAGGIPAQVAER